MNNKNKKKEEAKKQRNYWGINPTTRVAPNRNEYDRFEFRKNKKVYEEDMMFSEDFE